MKRFYSILTIAVSLLAASCSPESDFIDTNGNGTPEGGSQDGSSAGTSTTVTPAASITELTSMDISLDETALAESEVIPTDETADSYEDYIENNEFTNVVTITFNGSSASYSGSVSGVDITVNEGTADVTVNSSAKKVKYIVTGTTTDGFLKISLSDNSGNNIFAFSVPRNYSQQGYTLVVSSPKLTQGSSYTFSTGATVSGGTSFCGYTTDATVSGGTSLATLSLSSMITSYNYNSGIGGGGQPGGGNNGQPGGDGGQPGKW